MMMMMLTMMTMTFDGPLGAYGLGTSVAQSHHVRLHKADCSSYQFHVLFLALWALGEKSAAYSSCFIGAPATLD